MQLPTGWKTNVCLALYIAGKNFLFQRFRKLLLFLNKFLKATQCLGLVKVLKFFILTEIFENATVFQQFGIFIITIETLEFSRQFGLQK